MISLGHVEVEADGRHGPGVPDGGLHPAQRLVVPQHAGQYPPHDPPQLRLARRRARCLAAAVAEHGAPPGPAGGGVLAEVVQQGVGEGRGDAGHGAQVGAGRGVVLVGHHGRPGGHLGRGRGGQEHWLSGQGRRSRRGQGEMARSFLC